MAKKILLADDSITIQKVVELTFSDGDYEVIAVNNGAKAIQKLSEVRPDIILSDIIMPEKNGYEVCEFVKSHPDYRTIPVVLLTGTFEPFDPDRADKAGCDAVVTKPFESQSLIQKVDELIRQAHSAAPAPPPPPEPEPSAAEASPWAEVPEREESSPFAPPTDVFGGTEAPSATSEMPFAAPPPPPAPASPWDEGSGYSGETRAFPKMSFEEMQRMASAPPPPPPPAPPLDSPFETASAEAFSSETRAIPKMSADEIRRLAEQAAAASAPPPPPPPAAPPAAPEPSPWDEAPASGGETRAFPKMSFEEMRQMASEPAPSLPEPPAPPPLPEPSPWEEPAPSFGAETRAFPAMSLEELPPPPEMPPPPPPIEIPSWEPPPPTEAAAEPAMEELPPPPSAIPFEEPAAAPEWAPPPAAAAAEAPAPAGTAPAPAVGELTDEQIDRIARRVVQLMSDQVVRNIAWEVIPDLAEMVVKERIRQLESE